MPNITFKTENSITYVFYKNTQLPCKWVTQTIFDLKQKYNIDVIPQLSNLIKNEITYIDPLHFLTQDDIKKEINKYLIKECKSTTQP